jgi:signal transduction histidine kinase
LGEFRMPSSARRTGDLYLFGESLDGLVWINVASPKREGTNVNSPKDANGKLFHAEMAKTVKANGAGRIDYMWPKPGQNQPSQECRYV